MKKNISNLNPFNNATDMPIAQYIIKKVLAFVLIYCISALIGEGVIIGMLHGMGYDPLHGVMPKGQLADLLPYYGMIIFILVTFLYCMLIEKRNPKSIGFTKKVSDYLLGTLIAIILLIIIIGVSCVFGSIEFIGIINLYLISFIFSELVISRSNLWIACGLHSVWNFVLYTVMGLTLSGSEGTLNNVIIFEVKKANVLNGGEYGIEASIITTIVLGIFLFVLLTKSKGRKYENGVQ